MTTYGESLKPWAVVRLLPNLKWSVICRYRNRSDADGHLQLCRRRVPNIRFEVVFDLAANPVRADVNEAMPGIQIRR